MKFEEKYPFPAKALILMADLRKEEKITDEQLKVLNDSIINYMDLRCEFCDGILSPDWEINLLPMPKKE